MSVRVIARIRPLLKQELDKDVIVSADPTTEENVNQRPTIVRIPNPKNEAESYSFQFSSVFEQHATQQELFDAELSPTVKHLFNGFDLSIFAHGSTGTGKTYTMRGGKTLAERGVIPRLLSAVYRRCKKIEKDTGGETQVEVTLEYFEIYCDRIYDLFDPPEKRTPSGLPIRDNNGKTVVVGLTEKPCATLKEFEQLYDQANINRSTSATKLNAHSSRSHAVLCVKITQTTETTVRVSRASCIDLAGSEDNRRTQNDKERMVESNAINSSLFALANCVDALNKKLPRIPYRESKMTRILGLGQSNGLTVMILNLAPTRAYHLDTISSLNFASRTKKIEVCEIENDPILRTMTRPLVATGCIGGSAIARQPLRPLAISNNANKPAANAKTSNMKPVKAFSVYFDNRKPAPRLSSPNTQNQGLRRAEAPKRAADPNILAPRPSKAYRAADSVLRTRDTEIPLTKDSIEALISKRIDEKLAERALQDAAVAAPSLSADLQKRLDELEQRIGAKDDDEKGQGLQFLLMAKQHTVRGEDASALRMYQMAQPFFSGNKKLKAKMEALEDRIRQKKEAENINRDVTHTIKQTSTLLSIPPTKSAAPIGKSKVSKRMNFYSDDSDGDDYAPELELEDQSYESEDDFQSKKTSRKPMGTARRMPVFRDTVGTADATQQTPRTTHLLKIINTRDVTQIKTLKGVGARKADAIISCLVEMDEEGIRDLEGLASLKGVGGKTVESMRQGLGITL